jgi:hypothetical protein
MRLAGVIASFLTNLTVAPADPGPLAVIGGVLLLTALAIFFAAARPARAGR